MTASRDETFESAVVLLRCVTVVGEVVFTLWCVTVVGEVVLTLWCASVVVGGSGVHTEVCQCSGGRWYLKD